MKLDKVSIEVPKNYLNKTEAKAWMFCWDKRLQKGDVLMYLQRFGRGSYCKNEKPKLSPMGRRFVLVVTTHETCGQSTSHTSECDLDLAATDLPPWGRCKREAAWRRWGERHILRKVREAQCQQLITLSRGFFLQPNSAQIYNSPIPLWTFRHSSWNVSLLLNYCHVLLRTQSGEKDSIWRPDAIFTDTHKTALPNK